MNKSEGSRKVRGKCSVCGRGIHLWERVRVADEAATEEVVIESGWTHDKDEHNTHPVPIP